MASPENASLPSQPAPATGAVETTLCKRCSPIRAELLFGRTINKHTVPPRSWLGRPLEKEGWYGPTIGEVLSCQDSCRLCAAVVKSVVRRNALDGLPDRRSRLTFVTPSGHVCDGRTLWDPYHPEKQFEEEMILSSRNKSEGFGVAGLAIDVESEPGCDDIPYEATHGFKVAAPFECTEEVRRLCTRREVSREVDSRSFETGLGWLKSCEDKHITCRRTLSGTDIAAQDHVDLPTRVIDVQKGRLLETRGEKGRYAALSYRWPTGEPVKLLRANLGHFKKQIPLARLPITLAQAIEATKRLDIPYLWIDALCIVQDDSEDWEREAKLMYGVYQFAALTIALLGDTNTPEGFFHRRYDSPWLRIPWYEPNDEADCEEPDDQESEWGEQRKSVEFYYGAVRNEQAALETKTAIKGYFDVLSETTFGEEQNILGRGLLRSELQDSTWSTRGWTYQERLLSRRVLYFGKEQLFWECTDTARSEDTYDNVTDSRGNRKTPLGISSLQWGAQRQSGVLKTGWEFLRDNLIPSQKEMEEDGEPDSFSRGAMNFANYVAQSKFANGYVNLWSKAENLAWRTTQVDIILWTGINVDLMLREFTQRQLSFSKDRLIAFRGLGEAIAARTGQEYKAGVFTGKLAKGLFWCSLGGNAQTPMPYVAPTWSWGSRTGSTKMCSDIPIDVYKNDPDFGAYLGSLKHYAFRDKNEIMAADSGSTACEPLSLEIKAMCLQLTRSSQPCASFPRIMQQLKDDIWLWPLRYDPWPFERCHLLYTSFSLSTRKSKKALFICPQCAETFSTSSDVDVNLHAECCNHQIHRSSTASSRTDLAGVALFDNPEDPPTSLTSLLLWEDRDSWLSAKNKKTQLMNDEETHEFMRKHGDPARRVPAALDKSATSVLNIASHPMQPIGLTGRGSKKRTYFVLLVQECPGAGERKFKRVGIGLLYWVPGLDRFGGVEFGKESKTRTITLL